MDGVLNKALSTTEVFRKGSGWVEASCLCPLSVCLSHACLDVGLWTNIARPRGCLQMAGRSVKEWRNGFQLPMVVAGSPRARGARPFPRSGFLPRAHGRAVDTDTSPLCCLFSSCWGLSLVGGR